MHITIEFRMAGFIFVGEPSFLPSFQMQRRRHYISSSLGAKVGENISVSLSLDILYLSRARVREKASGEEEEVCLVAL